MSQDFAVIITSELTRVEVRSVLARHQRNRILDVTKATTIFNYVENRLNSAGGYLPLSSQVITTALAFFAEYPQEYLKSLDALHIATAHTFGIQHLVTNDKKQADFAALTGLEVTLLSDLLLM